MAAVMPGAMSKAWDCLAAAYVTPGTPEAKSNAAAVAPSTLKAGDMGDGSLPLCRGYEEGERS
ncbi:hypothetical protein Ahu01nite_050600 [Winogradskya humida]|uniref:Uncharacterized protein n=1 Tax=Winogradskya humida TaxID=113566 RepID=A0ABQ3ZTT8_9ACTN|nr:hypothetical protein Ahu01nite_050600 [Actinoplanes humidus]